MRRVALVSGIALVACSGSPDPRAAGDAAAPMADARADGDGSSDAAVARRDAASSWSPCGAPVRRIEVPIPPLRWAYDARADLLAGAGNEVLVARVDGRDDELTLVLHDATLTDPVTVRTRETAIGMVDGLVLDGPSLLALRAEAPAAILLGDDESATYADAEVDGDPRLIRHPLDDRDRPYLATAAGDGFAVLGGGPHDSFVMSLVDASGIESLAVGDVSQSGGIFWTTGHVAHDALWALSRGDGSPRLLRGDTTTQVIESRPVPELSSGATDVMDLIGLPDGGVLVAVTVVGAIHLGWVGPDMGSVGSLEVPLMGPVLDVAVAGDMPSQVIALVAGSPPSLFVAVASSPGVLSSPLRLVETFGYEHRRQWVTAFAADGDVRRVAYLTGNLRVLELCGVLP